MEFIKNLHLQQMPTGKKVLLLGVALVIVAILLTVVKVALTTTMGVSPSFDNSLSYEGERGSAPSYGNIGTEAVQSYDAKSGVVSNFNTSFFPPEMPIPFPPPFPDPGTTPGGDAEEYEITSYNASIRAHGESEGVCASVATLKSRKDVIFENSSESDTGCSYIFKVTNAKAAEILAIIKGLNPKSLDENTYTIKRTIIGLTSEIDILTKKLASVEATLNQALDAYNEISKIATADKDAESLAKIIDSKVNLIERLTTERINVQNQITTIRRAYADQLDHLNYTVFTVSIYEQKVVDFEQIGDSWIAELRSFSVQLNATLQQMTIGILGFIIDLMYYALVFVIILSVAKYGWRMTKEFWKS